MSTLLSMRISAGYHGKPDVLRNIDLDIGDGEIVGLAGRSGEGKSTIALAVLGLLASKGGSCRGEIVFRGRDLNRLSRNEMRAIRGLEIAFVPQSPLASLHPNLRLGSQLQEAWRAHKRGAPDAKSLLESVSLPADDAFLRQYPKNLSVGIAQRFLIALAILHRPALILADEPTSALDMITQADILDLFTTLNRQHGIAILYISHDLASVASLCHRVAILNEGMIVEQAPVEQLFSDPKHEYTKRLIASIPKIPETVSSR